MENEMITRAARHLCRTHQEVDFAKALAYSRTAIEAMREPTEAMLDAACDVGPDTNSGEFSYDAARLVYRAMIDAARAPAGATNTLAPVKQTPEFSRQWAAGAISDGPLQVVYFKLPRGAP